MWFGGNSKEVVKRDMIKLKKLKKQAKKYFKSINHWHYLILGLIAFGVVYLVKFFGYSAEIRMVRIQVVGKNWSDTYTQYEGYRPPFWLTGVVNEGDVERGPEGSVNAEVIKVERYERGGDSFDLYLTVKLNGVTNVKLSKFTYRGNVIEVGAPIELSLNRAVVNGQIIDDNVPKKGYKSQKFLIKVIKQQTENWVADSIIVGDVMTDGKNIIARVVNKKVRYSKNYFFSETNNFYQGLSLIRDNSFKEVELDLEIVANRHTGLWYFAGSQPLKINNRIYLYFENVNFSSAKIVSILEIDGTE